MAADGLAELAGLLADRTRATVCSALLDGRAWTAGELAKVAGVTASTMSEHLSRLAEGGLLVERRQGRHRYVELAGPEVAGAVEQLLVLVGPEPLSRPARPSVAEPLRRGRTCYDHLAGRLGVVVTEAMVQRGLLDDDNGLAITAAGHRLLAAEFGADLAAARRPLTRACLDWTERRPHVAGAAGAFLCNEFLTRGWIRRVTPPRAVVVTAAGETALRRLFGLTPVHWSEST